MAGPFRLVQMDLSQDRYIWTCPKENLNLKNRTKIFFHFCINSFNMNKTFAYYKLSFEHSLIYLKI